MVRRATCVLIFLLSLLAFTQPVSADRAADLERLLALPATQPLIGRLVDSFVERALLEATNNQSPSEMQLARANALAETERPAITQAVKNAVADQLMRRRPGSVAAMLAFAQSSVGAGAMARYQKATPFEAVLEGRVPDPTSIEPVVRAVAQDLASLPNVEDAFAKVDTDRLSNASPEELLAAIQGSVQEPEAMLSPYVDGLARTHTIEELSALARLFEGQQGDRGFPVSILELPRQVDQMLFRDELVLAKKIKEMF